MFPKPARIKNKKEIKKARKKYCEYCGGTWGIEVHHYRSRGAGGNDGKENLISLCWGCHRKVHNGQIPKEKIKYIIEKRESIGRPNED